MDKRPAGSSKQKKPKKKKSNTSAVSRLFSIGKMGLDLAKSEAGYRIQKKLERSKSLEKLDTQIKQMQTITKTLGEMKGAVMKVGQMLSLYDIPGIPNEVRDILSRLQKQAPALPFEEMKQVIETDMPDFFKRVTLLSEEPLAAASIGQVYQGVTQQGDPVAIKVQIPDIEKIIRSDLKNMKVLARVFSPWVTQKEMQAIFKEITTHLLEECDYHLEAKNILWYQRVFGSHPVIVFPKPYLPLSSKRVLTMSLLEGQDIHQFLNSNPSTKQCNEITYQLQNFYFDQIIRHSIVHADPQFGNYLIQKDKIAVLDFGAVKRFEPNFIHNLIIFLNACVDMDLERLHEGYLALGLMTRRDSKKLSELLDNYIDIAKKTYIRERYQYGDYTVIHQIFKTFPKLLQQKKLHLPPDFILLKRAVAGLYLLSEKMKADVPIRSLIQTYVIESPTAKMDYIY